MTELTQLVDALIEAAWTGGPHGEETEQAKMRLLEYAETWRAEEPRAEWRP